MTGPGTAQQNCVLEMPNTKRHKEKTHECNPWATLQSEGKYHQTPNYKHVHSVGETSVRRHILSDTKLQTLKKNPMLEENVAKASVRSHISGYQKRLAGRSVRARNKSAKLSPTVFQCLQTQ